MPNNWVDALFNRSLDVFGKILPGLVLLTALVISLKSWDGASGFITSIPWGAWIAAFAAGWVTGFAVQSFGEVNFQKLLIWLRAEKLLQCQVKSCKLIRYYPREIKDFPKDFSNFSGETTDYQWYQMTAKFRAREDYGRHKDGFNRLSLIKEACGNMYVALILATPLLICDIFRGLWFVKVPFLVIITLLLMMMHFRHVDRHYEYVKAVLNSEDKPATSA